MSLLLRMVCAGSLMLTPEAYALAGIIDKTTGETYAGYDSANCSASAGDQNVCCGCEDTCLIGGREGATGGPGALRVGGGGPGTGGPGGFGSDGLNGGIEFGYAQVGGFGAAGSGMSIAGSGGGCGSGCGSGTTAGSFSGLPNSSAPNVSHLASANPSSPNGPLMKGGTTSGPFIVNSSAALMHSAWDIPQTSADSIGVLRIHRPLDYSSHGSFGPGVFSQFDDTVYLNHTSGTTTALDVRFLSTRVTFTKKYNRGAGPSFSNLVPTQRENLKSVVLLKSDLTPITTANYATFDDAEFIQANSYDGTYVRYKLFDLGTAGSRVAKVCQIKSAAGITTITFKTWTPAELAASPERAFQIDTVTDCYGKTLSFTYGSTLVGGGWVVTQITSPGGNNCTYAYASNKLASVTYADSKQSTFGYGSVAVAFCDTVTFNDLAADQDARHFTAYLKNGSSQHNGSPFAFPYYGIRLVVNSNDEVEYLSARSNLSNQFHYEGGGQLKFVSQDTSSYHSLDVLLSGYMKDGWQFVAQADQVGYFTGTTEPRYGQTIDFGGSESNISNTQQDGSTCKFIFGTGTLQDRVIRKEYPDGSFEAFCYVDPTDTTNTITQITRHRDQLGRITRYKYDSSQRLINQWTGIQDDPNNLQYNPYTGDIIYNNCSTSETQTSDYAAQTWSYVASGNGAGQLASYTDPRGKVTSYQYNAEGRLWKVLAPPDTTGPAPTTTYAYDTAGRVSSVTDPLGFVVNFAYDARGRLTTTTYQDGTSEVVEFIASGNGLGLIEKSIDRSKAVTTYSYDSSDRLIQKVTGGFVRNTSGVDVATPAGTASTQSWTYVAGTDLVDKHTVDGVQTEYVRDYRGRVLETKVSPRVGTTLIAAKTYDNDQLYKSTDPYGRSTYYAYDATFGRLIRTITATVPEWTPPAPSGSQTFSAALLAVNRDNAANAKYVVQDMVYNAEGELIDQIDPRGKITRSAYDSRGRTIQSVDAFGTALEAKTETLYDLASNVTEVRSPRYFDSTDTLGYNKARETWTYTGRNLVASHSEAPGTSEAATESFTYDLRGHKATHTDFRGKLWTAIEAGCCALTRASVNPLGHGAIVNADPRGKAVHQITVSTVSASASNYNDPPTANTITESTTRFDARGRPIATTRWLSARGLVDTSNPPIAGLDGLSSSLGLSTQYFYDDNLTDGIGLDNATGVAYTKMDSGSGTANISLSIALTKLASTQANGGAGISFNSTSAGKARVTINPRDEISFSIMDAAGRTVMSGQLDNYTGTANALLTWSCQLHDTTQNLAGYGTVLESISIDALGKTTKSWTDAAGRTLRSIDQLAKVTTYTYDATGQRLTVRDPNNVGQDCVYDLRGRDTQCTDTASAVTSSGFDKASNKITSVDAKNKTIVYAFDARGRQKSVTDRISGVTNYAYLTTGQLSSLTDAESQTTSYTYDDVGVKLTEQYPDHTGGTVGQASYGIVSFTLDAASRVVRKQDQQGDTCTFNYDFAGRMTSRDYRTAANSPSGTIADTDSFTYDKASRMLTAVSGRYANTVTYTFDSAGRKKTEGLTISGQTYTSTAEYNSRSELIQTTYPDSTVIQRTYTDRGELYQNKLSGTVIDTRAYDDGGRMTASTYGNGVAETRTYGTDDTLTAINFGGTGSAIGSLAYGWDANKNKTSESIAGTMSNYGFTIPTNGYDNEDRLVNYNRTSGLNQSWNLTTVGDWSSVTTNGTAQTRTHGPTHELLTGASQNVTTDTKGNITLIPSSLRPNASSLSTTWDFDNRMVIADVGANGSIEVSHKYDALGRRVSRTEGSTTTVFALLDQQVICDYVAGEVPSASTYKYIYASYIDEPILRCTTTGGSKLYYHRNQQYSIIAVTSGDAGSLGRIEERYAYTAYGQPTIADDNGQAYSGSTSTVNNRYMYTGQEWDSVTNQFHFNARTYDPGLGRFCSRDPIGYEDGENQYCYCQSQPFNLIDSTGLTSVLASGGSARCTVEFARIFYVTKYNKHKKSYIKVRRLMCEMSCKCPNQGKVDVSRDITVPNGHASNREKCEEIRLLTELAFQCPEPEQEPPPMLSTFGNAPEKLFRWILRGLQGPPSREPIMIYGYPGRYSCPSFGKSFAPFAPGVPSFIP